MVGHTARCVDCGIAVALGSPRYAKDIACVTVAVRIAGAAHHGGELATGQGERFSGIVRILQLGYDALEEILDKLEASTWCARRM